MLIIERKVDRTDQNGTSIGRQWRYCLRRSGRFRDLVEDVSYSDGYGDIISVGQLILSGTYVAIYTTIEEGGGRYGCGTEMTLDDVSTGKSTNLFGSACGPGGLDSFLLSSRGFASWHVTYYPIPTYSALLDVSCPSVSLCVAVDFAGNVLTSSNPTGSRDDWAVTTIRGGSAYPTAVSCPSTQFCAVVAQGEVFTSTDPTGGPSAWSATTITRCFPCLTSISCPSSWLCVAVDNSGDVVYSTDPTGGASAWTTVKVDGDLWIKRVSCTSPSLCVAVDDRGAVITTTNPTGGADAWSRAQADSEPYSPSLDDVSCPSSSLCVAAASDYTGGNLAISTNPTGGANAWTLTHVDGNREPISVSCASVSLCVGFDSVGNVITSTDPAGGAGAWSVTQGPDPAPYYGPGGTSVSCPSTSLCVGATNKGRIAASTNPSAGGASWSSELVDSPPCAITTPCAAEQIYAHDNHGTRILDSAPPGSGKSLADLQLTGNQLTWTHDGTPHQAQLG